MAIGVLATLEIKADCLAQFEQAFLQYQQTVRDSEPGNVFFALHKSRSSPATYVVMEQYQDEAALLAHTSAEYYRSIPDVFGPLMAAPPHIETLDAVTT